MSRCTPEPESTLSARKRERKTKNKPIRFDTIRRTQRAALSWPILVLSHLLQIQCECTTRWLCGAIKCVKSDREQQAAPITCTVYGPTGHCAHSTHMHTHSARDKNGNEIKMREKLNGNWMAWYHWNRLSDAHLCWLPFTDIYCLLNCF